MAGGVFAGDQVSKQWVAAHLPMDREVPVLPPVLYWLYTTNDGVAWSMFRRHTDFFAAVAAVFCVGMLVVVRRSIETSTFSAVVVGLLVGGAVGNLVDRARLHFVVDFINVHIGTLYNWPTFNVADSAISIGIVMLAYRYLILDHEHKDCLHHNPSSKV